MTLVSLSQFPTMEHCETIAVLPFWSEDAENPPTPGEPVRLYRCAGNPCEEQGHGRACDPSGLYYGYDEADGGSGLKLCARHFYEGHARPDAACRLVDMTLSEHGVAIAAFERERRRDLVPPPAPVAEFSPPSPAFTRGPWIVSESQNPGVYGGEKHFAVLSHPELNTGAVVCDVETIPDAAEQRANADLIASAPGLLGALQETLRALVALSRHPTFADAAPEFNAGGVGHEAIARGREAIAEAIGRVA